MLLRFVISAGYLAVFGGQARADQAGVGQVVPVAARYVFAPVGFDDNDEAEVILDGYLPSGCYRLTEPAVVVDAAFKTVAITPQARYFESPCIEALVPFSQVIKLGVLPEGDYRVDVSGSASGQVLAEKMNIAASTSAGPDDFLYAAVDSGTVLQAPTTGELTATISGRFTKSCMGFSEVRVIDTGKTVNVLPIMRVMAGECTAGEFPFTQTVTLPASVSLGRHLLHVRSLNGQAVNVLFYKNRS